MANSFVKDAMAVLWDEVAETSSINSTLSKDLEVHNMSSDANMGRHVDASGVGSDVEYIRQRFRFNVQDGIVSSSSDFQDLTERAIPIYRNKAKRVLAQIFTKDLRDPSLRQRAARDIAKDIATAVDEECYKTMIEQSSRVITSSNTFGFQDAIDAEVLMLNRGIGSYDKKLFLSSKHYAAVAKDLGQNQYNGPGDYPADALTKAKIPNLATFDTMRSDYLINLAGNSTTGITVNGASQGHTVATYDGGGNYLDNRSQFLTLSGITAATFPVGTKFTIAGVNALHEETREDTGELQTFTVIQADNTTPVIQPAIVATGPYRNCSAVPANAAAVSILNTATDAPSLFYTPESTVLIPGRLPVPVDAGGVVAMEASTQQGLPMRMTYKYDFHNEVIYCKALVFFDVQVVYPSMLGCILANQ